MEYRYTVTTKEGALRRGVWEASSPRDVITALRQQGFYVLEVRERPQRRTVREVVSSATARASLMERALLARHLALMLRSGLTVDRALEILASQTTRRGFRDALRRVRADVQRGDALSVACGRFPGIFSPLFIAVLRWGEAGGVLAESLERLAQQLEKDAQLRGAVRSAMVYPAIVVGATVVLGVVLSTFVLPRLLKVFEAFDFPLPLATRIFLLVGTAVSQQGLKLLLGAVALVFLFVLLLRVRALRPFFHRVMLGFPIVGGLVRDVNLARMERILGSLIRSGLPILEALTVTSQALGNERYRRALVELLAAAQRGRPVAEVLAATPKLFPPLVSQMVAVGEETGKLQDVLLYLADFTEEQVARTTKNLATTIEPILLVIVGVVVGGVALAIITPIYQFTGSLTR